MLHVSTDEVYGSIEHGLFTEESRISPNSPYAASKASSDLLVRAYHETYGMDIMITRCSNNYGPYQFPEKLIPLVISHALQGKAIPVYGDGQNVRDWVHVRDHNRAVDMVFHHAKAGDVYNIGGRNEQKNIDIIRTLLATIAEKTGMDRENLFRLITFVKDRLGHDRRYAIDPAKIEATLGWRPETAFDQGLADTVTWYLENKRWWNASFPASISNTTRSSTGKVHRMRVALTGADGMLGHAVKKVFSDAELIQFSRAGLDITNLDDAVSKIRDARPDVLIHAAAFTNVDACETEPEKAYLVNGIGTRNIAIACEDIHCPVIHISSDYVFDGTKTAPYDEWDMPNPVSHYGISKLMAEKFLSSLTNRFYIVRTSWLYGSNGKNFVDTIIRLLAEQDTLRVVNDQFGSPTFTDDLANTLKALIGHGYGIYHATNSGVCTWYEFAVEIAEKRGISKQILPVTSEEFMRPAKRPANSALNDTMLRLEGITPLRHWEDALDDYLARNS